MRKDNINIDDIFKTHNAINISNNYFILVWKIQINIYDHSFNLTSS